MKYHVFYNPLSANSTGKKAIKKLIKHLEGQEAEYIDMLGVEDFGEILNNIPENDRIVLAGGDGTLNEFINRTVNIDHRQQIDFFAMGSGNDFVRDLGRKKLDYVENINRYMKDLPVVSVNGKKRFFLNGIGYGIDGYCCEIADEKKKKSAGSVNYSLIALKGLLGDFSPRDAYITVDGKEYFHKNAWLAPTMNGRFFGGGVMVAPGQDRLRSDGKVSVVCMYGVGRITCLLRFSSLFSGKHVEKYKEMCSVYEGHEINVRFDRPCALQIDGETVLDVTSYSVRAGIQR